MMTLEFDVCESVCACVCRVVDTRVRCVHVSVCSGTLESDVCM
jgi:hypothetical protein